MSFEKFLSTIDEISVMPELIRNEERGCYEYPQEFHNRFLKLNDVIVYINQKTNMPFSIKMLEFIYNMIINNISLPDPTQNAQQNDIIETINALTDQYTQVVTLVQSIAAQVDGLTEQTETTESNTTTEPAMPAPIVDIRSEIMDVINSDDILNKLTTDIGSIVWNSINIKLESAVKQIVANIGSTKTSSVAPVNILNSKEDQPSIYKILVLKQSGFTGDEILKLADKGLL